MDRKTVVSMEETVRSSSWANHAWGALVGVWCGDAAGAPLEFAEAADVTGELLNAAIHMAGGGTHNMDPGGITDDGELTCALLGGLIAAGGYEYPRETIRQHYRNWLESEPFDVGRTCGAAFGPLMRINTESHANGALMRAVPIACVCAATAVTAETDVIPLIREYAAADAQLSHPNPVCVEANILYCIAVAHLIMNPGDALGAIEAAEAEAAKNCVTVAVKWLKDSEEDRCLDRLDFCLNSGHVRYGFTAAFHYLRRRFMYEEALRDVLRRGGDTDTNAAIVGGMIGALMGYMWIPEHIRGPVLAHDCTAASNRHVRPALYSPYRMWHPFSTMIPQGVAEAEKQKYYIIKEGPKDSKSLGGNCDSTIDWLLSEKAKHCDAIVNIDKILERLYSGGAI